MKNTWIFSLTGMQRKSLKGRLQAFHLLEEGALASRDPHCFLLSLHYETLRVYENPGQPFYTPKSRGFLPVEYVEEIIFFLFVPRSFTFPMDGHALKLPRCVLNFWGRTVNFCKYINF